MLDLSKIDIIPLEDIYKAQENAPIELLNTPLVKLNMEFPDKEIYLKLENTQPTGSFKVRGAYNDMINADQNKLKTFGAYAASSGNFAQGLAWTASQFGYKCEITVPDTAASVKINAIQNYGASVKRVSYAELWKCLMTKNYNGENAVHFQACSYHAMTANGVIGMEILEQLPDVSSIMVPYGGGTNSVGIASAVKQLKPDTSVYACEVEPIAPLKFALETGGPAHIPNFKPSFVGGLNGVSIFPWMWNIATKTLDGTIVASLRQICDATNLLISKNDIIAEGAAAVSVAAALRDETLKKKVVCIVTGGNIDKDQLNTIKRGHIPSV